MGYVDNLIERNADSFNRLAIIAKDLQSILIENEEMRKEIKRLKKVEKEYNDFCSSAVKQANEVFGKTLSMALNGFKKEEK